MTIIARSGAEAVRNSAVIGSAGTNTASRTLVQAGRAGRLPPSACAKRQTPSSLILAGFAQSLAESVTIWERPRAARGRTVVEEADHRHRLLLRAGGEWPPNHRAAENSDEFAPPHARPLDPMASKQYGSIEPSHIRWANGGFPRAP